MILLKDLLAPWFHYAGAETFYSLTLDSRQIDEGKVFVALPGYQVDGRKYINAAIENGAVAVLAHTDDPAQHEHVELINSVPIIHFCQLTRQLSAVAAQYYSVSNKLKVIAVATGSFHAEELMEYEPDLLIRNLESDFSELTEYLTSLA